ncbi:MAG: T9SS type A sorting domain-containing protein [Cryomorphaceae bacterium]
MKRSVLTFIIAFAAITGLRAQYPVVTIEQIQTVTQSALGNCDDQTFYLGDTVTVRAKVVMDGNLAVPSGVGATNGHKNLWLQQGSGGAYKGIDLFSLGGTSVSEDPHNLVAGDSVEIIGVVEDYNGETELLPLEGSSITIIGQGQPIYAIEAQISDLNDDERNNKLETGEQWEGTYVEIYGATVASVDFFSGGSRVSFNIEDQFGNLLNVSDRFIVQKLPAEGGTFVAPNVGDQLDTIRGIIAHSKNNCPGFSGRGYELYPFQASDYVYGAAAPRIFNIARTPLVPTSSQNVTITSDITDNDGNVSSATVYYATGASGGSFTPVSMSFVSGETYTADIPAQADGTLIRWYITAQDDSGLVTTLPSNDPNNNTYLYRVRNNGLSIFDVQYTPFNNGISPYVDQTVSVSGVVTSSVNSTDTGDLGFVYIQQEGQLNFAGIWLQQGSTISQLNRGDLVTVEGVVTESFGMTALTDIASVSVDGTGSISPVVLNPDSFSVLTASQEQYEGMLVRMEHPTSGNRLYVVEQNADAVTSNNYAEYRIGTDEFNPSAGCRIITGRLSGNSSLFVSYVNDSLWTTSNGTMSVDPYIVDYGHSLTSISGILYYSFGNMKLLPRNNNDVVGYGDAPVTALFHAAADTVCVNDTIQFFNRSSVIADQFEWGFGDGSDDTAENPMKVYASGGWFDVTLVAENSVDGAADTATKVNAIYVDSSESCVTVGVSTVSNDIKTTVYPNPSADVIHIQSGFDGKTVYSISLIDVQGRELIRRLTRRSNESLQLGQIAPGQYFIEVKDANGRSIQVLPIIKR